MNTETNDLALDLERRHEIQVVMELLEQLMAAEDRPRLEYTQIRYMVLDAFERLGEAATVYDKLIEERQEGRKVN